MKKVDWSHAPDWAKYAAMDKDERWFFFSDEPKYRSFEGSWGHGKYDSRSKEVTEFLDRASESLERRP